MLGSTQVDPAVKSSPQSNTSQSEKYENHLYITRILGPGDFGG